MAILCVQATPNRHPTDARLDAHRLQEGDVVDIVDDTHVFSLAERACGQYRFLHVPGVSRDELRNLTAAVMDTEDRPVQRRALTLDLAAMRPETTSTMRALGEVPAMTREQIAAITRMRT